MASFLHPLALRFAQYSARQRRHERIRDLLGAFTSTDAGFYAANVLVDAGISGTDLEMLRATRDKPAFREALTALRYLRRVYAARARINAEWLSNHLDDMRADVRRQYEGEVA